MIELIESDSAQGTDVFRQMLLEYASKDLDNAPQSSIWKDLDQLPGRYAAPSGSIVLARADAQWVACGALAPTAHAGVAEIKRIYVRDAWRRQGLARQITQRLIEIAAQRGYAQAALSTWAHDQGALTLYHQMGFVPVPPFKEHPSPLVFLGFDCAHRA